MKQYSAKNIKNVALAGHSNAGKTSLAEALLFATKATDRLGKIADGNTVMDFDPEEIKRTASISSALAYFEWKDEKINLLDTPGLFDFEAGVVEGVSAAETVLVCLSGKSGVSVGTEKAFKRAKKTGKAIAFFINKLDSEHADFDKVLAQMREVFGAAVCPIVYPVTENHKVTCYVDLLTMKAFAYEQGGKAGEIPIPAAAQSKIDELMDAIAEAVAETSDEYMEKYFSGEPFTQEEVVQGVRNGVKAGTLFPVYGGASQSMEGIDLLMYSLLRMLPTAAEKAGETGTDAAGEKVEIPCDENGPLVAYTFKTVADPFVGKLSYVKVVSGKLTSDMQPVNARTGNPERMGKLILLKGKKQEETAAICAGDIGAITKLSETVTGDTLCAPGKIVTLDAGRFPKPTQSMAIKLKAKGDEGKISGVISRLMEEDPTLSYETNVETHEQIISGLGEQHLDVAISRMKSKFGMEVELVPPKVPYRETIRKKVKVQGRHKKQSGGHGQFGDVWIEFEPCEEEFIFEEKIFGGAVPKSFFPAVEKGLRDSIQKGVLAGYPVVGLKATLVDGSYHPVDSSEMSFKMAANLAYKTGVAQASPALLEPIGTLRALVPDANAGDLMGDINKRRGRVLGMNPDEAGLQLIEAEVPMSEMYDFTTALRSMTQGRGSYTLSFERYEQVPPQLEAGIIEAAKADKDE